jgi:hypothetical protein
MKADAEKAVKELKDAGEWDSYEERINYLCELSPGSPKRGLVLIILRGETPETILINLELKGSRSRNRIEEIKRQIRIYFESKAHKEMKMPKVFTLKEVLRDYPTISKWFYGINS